MNAVRGNLEHMLREKSVKSASTTVIQKGKWTRRRVKMDGTCAFMEKNCAAPCPWRTPGSQSPLPQHVYVQQIPNVNIIKRKMATYAINCN